MINILLIIDMSIPRTTLFKGIFNRFGSGNGPKPTMLALNIQKKIKNLFTLFLENLSFVFFHILL